jgi:hypothetical protein
MPSNATLYETDFHAWANEQAELLRAGKISEADIPNIAEEIESMGRSEKRELVSRLTVLLMHLLKWQFQPGLRGKSWHSTIKEQRYRLDRHLHHNPSLRSHVAEAMEESYALAVIRGERETALDGASFPSTSPFTFDEAMNPNFWPD